MSVAEAVTVKKFSDLSLDEKLDRLAEVAVKVGLGLKEGQELIMSAPMDSLPLARKIVEQAYKAGAKLVTTFYADDPSALARFQFA
ncbi:MAG TPA: aminopeptidase, partial [Edaphobacter sp.]